MLEKSLIILHSSESNRRTMTMEEDEQIEINISNVNSKSQIVLNDLCLLELLYKYPFLYGKSEHGYGDMDYAEWGWEEIAKSFNKSYEGLEIGVLFSVEELQWRWETLRHICPSLVKANGEIPDSLWFIICKITRSMTNKTTVKKDFTATQEFLLKQLPLLENLTVQQRQHLEVEVLDAILSQEQSVNSEELTERAENVVESQYYGFLQTIRVKELRQQAIKSPDAEESVPTEQELESITEPPLKLRYVPLKNVKYYVKGLRVKLKRYRQRDYSKIH